MALSRVKVWGSEILTAADLNSEFDNILNNPFSLISPVTSDITWNDSINATFGTGGDADIRYDGTDLLILPAVVGTGNLRISGGSLMTQDNEGVYFGTGDDARIYYDGTDMYFDSDVVGTGQFIFNAARMILLNDTANTGMTTGITLNQGGADNEIIALKSSDVAHGITTQTETDTYAFFKKATAASGGLQIQSFNGTANDSFYLVAISGADSSTRSTAAVAPIVLSSYLKTGTDQGAQAANQNTLVVQSGSTTRFILDSDGDSHQDVGTAWTNFDDFDDVALLNILSAHITRIDDPLKANFADWLLESKGPLEKAKIVTFNSDGHHFINWSRCHMLEIGAIRQIANRLEVIEQKFMEA